jgi:hypothetical protein
MALLSQLALHRHIDGTLGALISLVVLAHGRNVILVLVPEILLAVRGTHNPWWEDAANKLVGPWLLEFLSRWDDAATGHLLEDPDDGVEDGVGDDTGDETVGDGVGEWHNGERDESRDGVTRVAPVDDGGSLAHHGSDDDQSTASSPWRDGGEDRCEEDGDEEADSGGDSGETGLATFGDTSTRLDESGDGGEAEEGADGDTEGCGMLVKIIDSEEWWENLPSTM